MRVPEHPTLIRRMLDSRLAGLAADKPILAASLVQITKHCGRSCCHCQQGGPLHTAHHLTYKIQGKTRTIYVPLDLLCHSRSGSEPLSRREVSHLQGCTARRFVQAVGLEERFRE